MERETIGLTLAAVGVFSAIVQGGLIRKGVALMGERRALLFGLACGAAGFAVYGLASGSLWFCAGIPLGALWGFAGASAQAIMSQKVDASEQGRLQGALAGMRGITGMIGPTFFTSIFAWSIGPRVSSPMPGTPFLASAGLLVAAAMLAWFAAGHAAPRAQG